jgi:hypothetical protein
MGIPAAIIVRQGFTRIVANAFAGFGLPREAPVLYEFPTAMFESGSDLTPINQNIDKLVAALTTWTPRVSSKGVFKPPMVTITGKDYQNALENMQIHFMKNLWGAGLPINPPTKAAVDKLLTGTPLSAETVISPPGGVVPKGGIATVQSIAVALAMAGGRPEYMPVLISAVKAITNPKFGLKALNPTTNDMVPAIIVNGPIARQIRLSSGYGLMGPDPQYPASEILGRAIRYIQQNLGGAIPGAGSMANFGGLRSVNAVFAEDETGLPEGWDSFAVEQGFKKDQNIVTAAAANSMVNLVMKTYGTKEKNDTMLKNIAAYITMSNTFGYVPLEAWQSPSLANGTLLMTRGFAAALASASATNYSKKDVKTFLWNNTLFPVERARAMGQAPLSTTGEDKLKPFVITDSAGKSVIPLTANSAQITIIIAGGEQSGHCYWMAANGPNGYLHVNDEILLPANWQELLQQAEKDLGPLPGSSASSDVRYL